MWSYSNAKLIFIEIIISLSILGYHISQSTITHASARQRLGFLASKWRLPSIDSEEISPV